MVSTVEWLRSHTDDELARMLAARPDLLLPAPPDLQTLARRMDSASAVRRALGNLTAFEVQVLRAAAQVAGGAAGGGGAATASAVTDVLGGPADVREVGAAAADLETIGLLIGEGDSGAPRRDAGYHLPEAVREGLSRIPELPDDAGEPDHAPEPGHASEPGQHPFGRALPHAPALAVTTHEAGTIDGTAAGQALAAHGVAAWLLEILGSGEVPSLKAGGVGITAVRRLATQCEMSPHLVTLYLEVLHAAGLIGLTMSPSGRADLWLPTQSADMFLGGDESAGWALLAATWLSLRRDASKVGVKDERGQGRNALSVGLEWRSGGRDRHWVLGALSELAPGEAASRTSIAAHLGFSAPFRRRAKLRELTDVVLTEATELGIVAFDALASAGRLLLADDLENAAAALDSAAPAIIDSFMVQADMTIIAAGRLSRELREALALACEVESSGGATVYRLTAGSVRRALDSGASASELQALIADHSVTDVPQSVSYLIDDVARRHGSLRAGAAGCYLRSDDPALIAQAVAAARASGLELQVLAPTVAVSGVDRDLLVTALQSTGLAPAAEDASGSVLDVRPRPRRTRMMPPPRPSYQPPGPPSANQIAHVVARMRAGGVAEQHPRDVMDVLREAARRRSTVWIQYADQQGSTSRRCVEPVTVSGGSMVAFDRLRGAPRTFAVHRISAVTPETSAPDA